MSDTRLNVVIPMGGIGSRFTKEQYRFPKPLVRICGREMLLWLLDHLCIMPGDTIWMAMPREMDEQFLITNRVRKEYPNLEIRTVHLQFQTQGAAETLYSLLQEMDQDHLSRRTVSLDCDTIYFSDILSSLRKLPPGEGASYYFEENSGRPIFSFLKLDEDGRIEDIREKVVISTHANTGAYAFASGKLLREYCAKRLDKDIGELGEYYTSSVIKEMMNDGHVFRGLHVEDFVCVGTPRQLQEFLVGLRSKKLDRGSMKTKSVHEIQKKKQRFCFDLDGTLVSFPEVSGDYSSVRPIESNIRLAQELHAAGHCIIIQTARRMKTHGGNVAAVIADVGKLTIETLDKFQIPYDELIFGKPHADVYIDDNAIHAQINTFKEIGWLRGEHVDGHEGYWEKKTLLPEPQSEMIDPRSFNTVITVGDAVLKSGPKHVILGERHFYENVPEELSGYFPKLLPSRDATSVDSCGEVSNLKTELIPGITFSTLLIGKCITTGRLLALLNVLKEMHSYKGDISEGDVKLDPSLFYQNYAPKLQHRFKEHESIYNELGDDASLHYEMILEHLAGYKGNDRARRANVIHGDPVFTNILLSKSNSIKMIDMRGCLGDVLTLKGDVVYDLGKVYQSITGYDFLLHHDEISDRDCIFLDKLEEHFWAFVSENYPTVRHDDVKMITASLYFSLIPLHAKSKRHLFFEQCRKIIDSRQ
mmetsp:Transcript_37079/g.66785  ORF Transcript_37079/g.66785 Transcript_37079/m.66785 type:complete len:702 (-) Transcript_37079:128-2233(-)